MDLRNKRVLVTGGSRGIGFAIVQAFLDAGARVALNGRTSQSVQAALDRLRGWDWVVGAPGDIGTVNGCEAVVKIALDHFGGLDILVNSAGIAAYRSIEESDEALWDAHLDVNLKGTYFCCRAALPALRESKGNIVNIASDAGLLGFSGLTVYCASKGGVVNLTKAMAIEIAPEVRVNCVCPGFVDTDMIRNGNPDPAAFATEEQKMMDAAPLRRIASPAEIADAVLYLSSPKARFVTGATLSIDGGTTAGR